MSHQRARRFTLHDTTPTKGRFFLAGQQKGRLQSNGVAWNWIPKLDVGGSNPLARFLVSSRTELHDGLVLVLVNLH